MDADDDRRWMLRALHLAQQGQGSVEPNPMVGCVIVRDGEFLAEGWHRRFGGAHAERDAHAQVKEPSRLAGATWYVSLEPCCHYGKTPPCTDLLLQSKPARVVVAHTDPFANVSGEGIRLLQQANIPVDVGVCEDEAIRLNAPYLTRLRNGRPWVICKWAMTLDGKIATRTGHSQWISGEASRSRVHQLRSRVDAIVIGIGTAIADDPLLTARPAGARVATRVVFDRAARLPLAGQLVRTAREMPVMVVCDHSASNSRLDGLRKSGVEMMVIDASTSVGQAQQFLQELGRRSMTNILVEGGAGLLASFFEAEAIDEYFVFVAGKIVGGKAAASPIAGIGLATLNDSPTCEPLKVESLDNDLLITTRRILP